MKKAIVVALACVSVVTEARMVGPYFGANWQYTNTRSLERDISGNSGEGSFKLSGNKLTVTGNSTAANNGFVDVDATTRGHGLRLNAGYQMNRWWAWDFSYNQFADAEWETTTGSKVINRQFTFDASGIASYAFSHGINATARGGISFLRSNIDFDGVVLGTNNFNINQSISNQITYRVQMHYGIGISYDWDQYTSINFDAIEYRGNGNIDDSTNFQVGLNYYFGS